MAKYFWVEVRHPDGRRAKYCVIGKVGKQCFSPTFLLMPQDDPNDALDELTNRVNSIIEDFIGDHPGENLRILANTEVGDRGDRLRFAFVGTDLEISFPDPEQVEG
jgi:hypothetical protein